MGWSPPHYIALITSTTWDGVLRFLEWSGSSSRIVWFLSPISCLGWEVFYQRDCLIYFSYLLFGLRDFSSSQPSQVFIKATRSSPPLSLPASLYQLLVFLLSYPTRLEGFSPITLHGSFGFPPQYSTGLGGFLSINLISSSSYPLELGAWYSEICFFFFTFLSNRQEVFSTILQNKYQTTLINDALNGACAWKKGNYNAVATKIMWLHLSTGIPLSLSIAFIYQLIPIGLLFGIIICILLLIGNRPSYICINKKRTSRHLTLLKLGSFLPSPPSSPLSSYICLLL